jgi:endoglucanase
MGLYAEYDLAMSGKDGAADAAGRLMAAADELAEKSMADGYMMGLMNNYPWGSNMTVANNGVLFGMAADVAANGTSSSKGYTEDDFKALAEAQLDYLLGANPLGYCYVTGFGTFTPEDPHHRPSQVAGAAMPGMLVGGPASGLEDPYAASVLADVPAAMCYVDNVQSYSTNEVTIYWNSPLVYLLTERIGR